MRSRIPGTVLFAVWIGALLILAAISRDYNATSTRFFGIADDLEQTIRFTMPVEIVSVGFVSGQEVAAGDLIVQVRRPELDARMQVIQEQIHALTYGNRESRATMQAEIVQQRASLQAGLAELDSQIRLLESRQNAAQVFFDELGEQNSYAGNPSLQSEIAGLNVRRQALRREASSRIDDLKARLTTPERAVDAKIAELEEQKQDLNRQRSELSVHARIAGRVGSVLFKVGETVPPYQPVLTVHGSAPSFVKGYIHESVVNDVRVMQTVWVQSANTAQDSTWHEGIVQGLGSRIVEFPERLKVNPLAQAWGREVIINLNGDHRLLLGEKVDVRLDHPTSSYAALRSQLAELVQ